MNDSELPIARNLEVFPDLHPALDARAAVTEANRCLNCFDAPCMVACPTHIDVPGFIKRIATGNLRGSARVILEANVLGMSCARACPVDVLCEGACVMHERNEKPIEIGRLQRFAMDDFYTRAEAKGWARLPRPPVRHDKRVACIGAGPASLAFATVMRAHGFATTVFDDRALPGGLATYGIAEYKLRPSDSQREIAMIRALGVEFRRAVVGDAAAQGGTTSSGSTAASGAGTAVSIDEIEREFALIFLGFGLGTMQRLGIPGEDAVGVVDALRFIGRYKTEPDFRTGRRVAVIGGGNTAIDAAIAARRLGAEDVQIFYRRTEEEMPAFRAEYEHALLEGVGFTWLSRPVLVIEDRGRVRGVRLQSTRLGERDADGRRACEPVAGTEIDHACDTVIPAVGQSRLAALLARTRGVAIENGSVAVDRETGRTANPRYYAGGDCVNGGREIVDAVADGKRAAAAALAQLGGDANG